MFNPVSHSQQCESAPPTGGVYSTVGKNVLMWNQSS